MAFGFIKKIFSFGKKDSESAQPAETPAESLTPADSAALEPSSADPAGFAPDGVYQPTPETAPDEIAPETTPEPLDESSEPEPGHPQPLHDRPEPEIPVAPAAPKPATPKPAAPKPAAPKPAEPKPAALEPARPTLAGPASGFAPDGVYQPSPETMRGQPATPEPLDESSEPEPGHPRPIQADAPIEPVVAPVAAAAPRPETAAAPPAKLVVGKAVEAAFVPAPAAPEPKKTWFQRLSSGLSRSSKELSSNIAAVFTKRKLDEDTLEELEEVLLRADLGMETAIRITGALSEGRFGKDISDSDVRAVMAAEIEKVLAPVAKPLELDLGHRPHVILVVGVNGTGKTTTIGKLAAKLSLGGLKVMLAAGDTFRAAAIEQLKIWGERTGSQVISSKLGADAAGLAYEAFAKAREAGSDVLIIDTAGRLHNKTELMDELEKIVRVLSRLDPDAPHTVLQTLDATTGQNALNQVEMFRNVAGVSGLVMTKLDGTARGGILVAIAARHKLPVWFIGVGEQVDDLEPFSAKDFALAIAGNPA